MPVTAIQPTDQQLFGVDLTLKNGDLAVATRDGLVDFATIGGRSNLQQALLNRLQSVPGDLPMHRQYGANINGLLGLGMAQAKALAFKYVVQSLNREPRIQKVTQVKLQDTANNAFDLLVTVMLVNQDTPVNFIFPSFLK